MKKLISVILVFAVVLSLCTTVFADYQLYDLDKGNKESTLSISGTTATCTSLATFHNTDVSSIKITQTLEKQGLPLLIQRLPLQ